MLPLFSELLEARKDVLRLQQELIEIEPRLHYKVVDDQHIRVDVKFRGETQTILFSIAAYEPFSATVDICDMTANGKSVNGFSAWTDHAGFHRHVSRMLPTFGNLQDGKLEEGFKHAVAAGVLAAASLTGSTLKAPAHEPVSAAQKAENDSETKRLTMKQHMAQEDNKKEARAKELASIVVDKYKVTDDFALKVARLAVKHEKPTFPKAEDILSVIGIESSFKPNVVSGLKHDPAVGLTQIRPGVWGIDPSKLKGNIENQVKIGANILKTYYDKVKSVPDALHAFNIGMTNFMKKKGLNPKYVQKFDAERELYEAEDPELQALLKWQQEIAEHTDVKITIPRSKEGLIVTGPNNLFKWLLVIRANPNYESGADVEVYESGAKNKTRLASHGLGEIIYVLRSYEELCELLPADQLSKCTATPWSIKIPGPNGDKFIINFQTPDQADANIIYEFEHKKGNKVLDGDAGYYAKTIAAELKRCLG
jgi:hypothetical protein